MPDRSQFDTRWQRWPVRYQRVLELHEQGFTLQQIGEQVGGVTKARAGQLVRQAQRRKGWLDEYYWHRRGRRYAARVLKRIVADLTSTD
jgi:hypothetical protein